MDFGINLMFLPNFEFGETGYLSNLCTLMQTRTPVPNPLQEVCHPDLQILLFDLSDMHSLIPRIEEVLKFPNVLSIKGNLGKFDQV
jgi:hypothetical protein